MNPIPSRTGKGWCIVNRNGHVFTDTVAYLRRDAIAAYVRTLDPPGSYRSDRRKYGVQVVRCTITTEPRSAEAEIARVRRDNSLVLGRFTP